MSASNPLKIALSAIALSAFASLTCSVFQTADAEDTKVRGATLWDLEGVYKYDSGGVPLFGYILKVPNNDNVMFIVCITAKTFEVSMKQLEPVNEHCKKSSSPPGAAPWSAWYYTDGKLVSSPKAKKTVGFNEVSVKELPQRYQGIVMTRSKQGGVAAYSFKDYKGEKALGVITKPYD